MSVSRFVNTRTKLLDSEDLRGKGTRVFQSTRPTKIEARIDDLIITVNEGDRMDLLANKFYGSPKLWFVIASVNNLTNGSMHIPVGTQIRIPAKNRIL